MAATETHQHLIGARLDTLEGHDVNEALRLIGPYVAHDSSAGKRFHALKLLSVPELTQAAGLSSDTGVIRLDVSPRGDAPATIELDALSYDASPKWVVPEGQSPRPEDAPFFEIERTPPNTLIVRVFQVNDHSRETLGAFSRRLTEAIDTTSPERVILDLRYCHGGDQSITRALVLPFIRWEKATRIGHLFALVGPETFSAAVNLASRLEEWTQVVFVGEPLGSGPSHYSSSDREVLSHSGLVVRVSTGYFVGWTGTESRESVEIGLAVKPKIADYLAGRDTALIEALEFQARESTSDQLIAAHQRGGINAALIVWSRYRTDPATAHLPAEIAGNDLAQYLFDAGEYRYSAGVFLYNREFHPSSIDAYLGEAEARLRLQQVERALEILEEAGRVDPGDVRIEEMRARILADRR